MSTSCLAQWAVYACCDQGDTWSIGHHNLLGWMWVTPGKRTMKFATEESARAALAQARQGYHYDIVVKMIS